MPSWRILQGNCLAVLPQLAERSIQTCCSSPPFWGLRDYEGEEFLWGSGPTAWRGALGLEPTPELFVEHLLLVFSAVKRVLRDDGTLWVNLGDSFAPETSPDGTLKEKDLAGVPWMFALAMRRAGWYLRSDIVWEKSNAMPDPTTDRPTRSHEYIFMFSKSPQYYYNADAIREEWADDRKGAAGGKDKVVKGRKREIKGTGLTRRPTEAPKTSGRNSRTVWRIANAVFPGAHFATYPPEVPRRCVTASAKPGDIVLDPFNGSGTTGEVALAHGCDYIGIEQNQDYIKLAQARLTGASRADLKAGDLVFCPGCERAGIVKMFERSAVERARSEDRKITCPKCMGRFSAADLGVKT